eukprot:687172_1
MDDSLNNSSLPNDSKETDTESQFDSLAPLAPHPLSLRFTSINSINRKIIVPEDVLKFAQDAIDTISKDSTVFDDAFTYQFDIFELTNYTQRPLLVLGVYLLSNASIFSSLFEENKVNLMQCAHFLDLCEKLYQTNPYHNHIHATDVMQFNMSLLASSFIHSHFEDYECLAAFMSAVAHDIGHIGKNNDFLVKSKHDLAIKFKNISCLENYHIEQFHQTITANSKGNFIKHFDTKTQHLMIDIVEYAILGTDMGVYHNEIKKTLRDHYTKEFVAKSSDQTLTFEQKKFLIRSMLHLSDISNPMRPFDTAKEWAHRVNEEFFKQGDAMKEMGLEISMGCDRSKTDVAKNQNGFVNFCVKPLTLSLSLMIAELKECVENMDANAVKWAAFKEETSCETNENEMNEKKNSSSGASDSSNDAVV